MSKSTSRTSLESESITPVMYDFWVSQAGPVFTAIETGTVVDGNLRFGSDMKPDYVSGVCKDW